MLSPNSNVLIELECLVCKEYMYPPIKQCTAGHSMCTVCFGKVTTCPTCRAALGISRNFALENILSKIEVPCKYKTSGCAAIKVGAVIRLHEEFCEYGEAPCPLKDSTNCAWVGKPKDFIKHAKENHDHHPPVINNTDVRIKNFLQKMGEGKYFQLVDAYNTVFKYCINMNYSKNVIQWNIQFVGPREDAHNYAYIIKFIDKDKGTEKYSVLSTCQQLVPDDQAFNATSTCSIHFDKLQKFCGEDKCLYFHFHITPAKDVESDITCIMEEDLDDASS